MTALLTALQTRFASLLEEQYWFAAVLPLLLFVLACAATFGAVTGFEAPLEWYAGQSATSKVGISFGGMVALFVCAWVLRGMTPALVIWCSGRSANPLWLPLLAAGTRLETYRFEWLAREAERFPRWSGVWNVFREKVKAAYDETRPAVPGTKLEEGFRRLALAEALRDPRSVSSSLESIVRLYESYRGSSLGPLYTRVKRALDARIEAEELPIRAAAIRLDREFGACIRATVLGNRLEAVENYSFTRYRMEPEIYWPRLRWVADKAFLAPLDAHRALLDFALTSASLFVLFTLLAAFGGPWLWANLWFWGPVSLAGMATARFFYTLAIHATDSMGDSMRGAVDLLRLDLLKHLGLERPSDIEAERKLWTQVSHLVVYGAVAENFALRKDDDVPAA